ncbi:putative kelch-type beta propeller [Rosa chinensis]|uniref:Putative kelch-type beta propeller n=1 Tax=Rosa chinensis TaxID=74649 RepID=A0A2P6RJ05_ROSCH|nr:putative kelch-type beta propeller [Rosa chinensis]
MSPKNCLNLAANRGSDGEENRHHRLRHRRIHGDKKHRLHGCTAAMKKKKGKLMEKAKKITTKKKTRKKKLKLTELETNKSLYICSLEHHEGMWVSYVVRAIKLSDLLSSSSDDDLQLRQLAYKAGTDLPGSVRCGVMGSQIVFAGGLKPSVPYGMGAIRTDSIWYRDVYAFETSDPKQQQHEIRKMDATLLGAKFSPWMVELGGKLYALCYMGVSHSPEFEVFDPKLQTWSALPQPPFFQHGSRYDNHAPFAYAIAGTKMFVSHELCPVFCFDVSQPDSGWRLVPTMCQGGPFPFIGTALVLDLPAAGGNKKKILFGHSARCCFSLAVYLISGLDENEESITQIGDLKLPIWPYELGPAAASDFVHIGGQKACLVITQFISSLEEEPRWNEPGTHKTQGVAIPFQFEIDITKLDKDEKDCFTLQFMPPRIFQYQTNPATYPSPETVGCFVL